MSEEKSPSEILAAQIVDQLIQSGLVRTEKRDSVVTKIASGNVAGGITTYAFASMLFTKERMIRKCGAQHILDR